MYELYDVSVLRRTTLPVGYFWDFLKFDDIVPNKNIFVMMDKLYGINNEFYRFLKKQSNNICIEKDFNTYKSLYKYLNRLCFRTTPLYDSSIVCTIITDPLKNLDLDTIDYKPYFYCKASYDWIYSLVDLIEEDENVLFCLKAKINNYCYCRNDIIVNLDSSSSDVQCSETFLKTSVLDYIFTNYTEEFLLDDLFNDLTSMYSSRGDKFIKNFIKTLVQKKVIISELREVPVNINLDYIVNILKKIKNNKYVYEVERINKFIKLINFKKLNIGYCEKLLSMMSAVCRVKEPLIYFLKDSVSGDLSNVYAEINEFVKFMTKNVITDNETMRLKFIKDKFISKYGSNVAINIRLVLDDIFGVNRDIKVEYNIKQLTSSANYFKQKIIDSINSAIVLGNDYVDISDISISKKIYELDSDTKDFFPLSSSFSLSFYIQNNQLMLSNMIGSNLGLNFFNRFKEVEDSFLDKFYELEEYYTENSYLIVQISELLRNYKINNVADNSSTYSNIFCKGGFSPGKFSLEDIYVAYDTNLDRLVIISKKYNKRIKFVLDSMLNIECCSEIVKLLLDISYGYEIHLTELINIISDIELPYIPTLKFKNIVVSNETWKLSSSYFEIDSFEKFEKSFFELKRKFKIVRYIYLLEGDNFCFLI